MVMIQLKDVHIFFILTPPPAPGGKLWVVGWLGKQNDYLLRKNANIRSKDGKKEIFTVLEGKNIILENGGGAKISMI